jgi:hypothetical protein
MEILFLFARGVHHLLRYAVAFGQTYVLIFLVSLTIFPCNTYPKIALFLICESTRFGVPIYDTIETYRTTSNMF